MKLVLIITGKKLLCDYKKNHLHFLAAQLSRKTKVQCVDFSFKSVLKSLKSIQEIGHVNTSTIIVPDRSRYLLIGILFWLMSKRRYFISWRLFQPVRFQAKLLYQLESILIFFSSHYLYIAENQLKGVGRFSRNSIFLPPVTARLKPQVAFDARTIWCPGGADRDENNFISKLNEKKYEIGYRTSANLKVLKEFERNYLRNYNIIVKRFEQPTKTINSDIFLETNNVDNPAGLTALYQNLFSGQKFYVKPMILTPPLVALNNELVITSEAISETYKIFDKRIREIATYEA